MIEKKMEDEKKLEKEIVISNKSRNTESRGTYGEPVVGQVGDKTG